VSTVHTRLDIELGGTFTRGATVVDLHRRTGRPPNAHVAVGIDTAKFWDLVIGAINRLPGSREV
jgi:purine nucleosidase/pyrimidine-specific ribonucleoside hydrolase